MRKKSFNTVFVVAVFFLSGFCGLIYEILWSRYLAELLGVTAMAQFVVLMVFMGGLSLGALWIGRLVDRGHNGLLCYGLLELVIGIYALFFTLLFRQAEEFYYWSAGGITPDTAAFFAYRFFLASLLIIVPSVAMGGTLPAVVHYLTSQRKGVRKNTSLLYGTNTLGGVLGGLVAGFFMIHHFGLATSMVAVGNLNVSLGLLALGVVWFSRCREQKQVANDGPGGRSELADEVTDSQVYSQDATGRALFAAGLAGFAAMALQVAWIRYFSIVLGNTHSAFTIVVTAFILGLGLGALVARSKVVASNSLPLVLTLSFALTATAIGWGLFFYVRVPFELSRLMGTFEHTAHSWAFHEILTFFFCFVLMALPTIASGMILPICTRIVSGDKDSVGRDVARVYAVNTLGCLLGIGVTSQLLFRMLSLPRTLQFIFFIYIAATIFLLFVLKEAGRKRMAVLIVVLLVIHVGFWHPWSPEELHIKSLQFGKMDPFPFDDFKVMNEQVVVVSSEQGPNVQVTVQDTIIDDVSCRSLVINGKSDASACEGTDSDMENQVITGHLPMLLHEKPSKVFVLGLGSGATTGELLKFPEVKQVVTVELAGEVFGASKFFAKYNNRFWEDPRSSVVIEDGKTFLQLSEEKFDVLIVQPTNINEHGMSGLYTEEFFRLAKSRMASGGMLAQWLQLYKLDDQTINIVIKTFSRVFPRASIFMTDQQSVLLIGYDEQWHFNPGQLAQRFNKPMILATQRQYGNNNPAGLLLREVMSRDAFQRYASALTAPLNTMDFPILEKAAEYAHFIDPPLDFLQEQDSRFKIERENLLFHDYVREVGLDPPQLREVIASRLLEHQPKLKRSFLFRFLTQIWADDQPNPPKEVLDQIFDRDFRQIITHPNYRVASERMTSDDALQMLGAELQLWENTSSQFSTPEPKRLQQLYDRYAAAVDPQEGGKVARYVALLLSSKRAYKTALPFLRLAEAKGQLVPEKLQESDLALVFACKVQAGMPVKAYRWWQEIEQRRCEVTPNIQQQKIVLDLKLVGMRELPLTSL